MVTPGFNDVKVQWGVWQAGGIAVPLCLSHQLPSLQYVIEDTAAAVTVVSAQYETLLQGLAIEKNIPLIVLGKTQQLPATPLPEIAASRRAMILYTSGITNKPKGVVSTFTNLEAQIFTLVNALEWYCKDHTRCVLALHHVYGIVNVISDEMWSGAICEFIP